MAILTHAQSWGGPLLGKFGPIARPFAQGRILPFFSLSSYKLG